MKKRTISAILMCVFSLQPISAANASMCSNSSGFVCSLRCHWDGQGGQQAANRVWERCLRDALFQCIHDETCDAAEITYSVSGFNRLITEYYQCTSTGMKRLTSASCHTRVDIDNYYELL